MLNFDREATMTMNLKKPAIYRVFAVYEDDATIFRLPADATMADLAECLAALAPRADDPLVHVEVRHGY